MRLFLVLMLCALSSAAVSRFQYEQALIPKDAGNEMSLERRNAFNKFINVENVINTLVRQLIAFVRRVINEGSAVFGIPPLDPLELEQISINIPAGVLNLTLGLENIYATGFGGFVTHTTDLNVRELYFDIDISFPHLDLRAGGYDFVGHLFTAIPLYGKGDAQFILDDLGFQAKLYLSQSEDGKSVIIDRAENVSYEIPTFQSRLTGMIGRDEIDADTNTLIEEAFIGYINRFQDAVSQMAGRAVVDILNPVLEQLDTWRFIARFVNEETLPKNLFKLKST